MEGQPELFQNGIQLDRIGGVHSLGTEPSYAIFQATGGRTKRNQAAKQGLRRGFLSIHFDAQSWQSLLVSRECQKNRNKVKTLLAYCSSSSPSGLRNTKLYSGSAWKLVSFQVLSLIEA